MNCPVVAITLALLGALWVIGHMVPCSERIDGAGVCRPDRETYAEQPPRSPDAGAAAAALAPADREAPAAPSATAAEPTPAAPQPLAPPSVAAGPLEESASAASIRSAAPRRGNSGRAAESRQPPRRLTRIATFGDPFRELLAWLRRNPVKPRETEPG